MIDRSLNQTITDKLFKGKVIMLLGARQTGKSTLFRNIITKTGKKVLFFDGDDPQTRIMLKDQSTPNLLRMIGDNEIVIIDEAQRIENIGLTIKQMHDNKPECQILVSGSSALELSNMINEPLTGRKWEYQLFTLSFNELQNHFGLFDEMRSLESRIIFGSYPDVINNVGNEQEVLKNLSGSYLYKDIFSFQDIRKPQLIERLLQLLAFQVASEVSFNELANSLQVSINTIEKYIFMLEKSFVIFRLPSFSRNIRNELRKSRKIYFYDNGIRNSIIANYSPVELRNDTGSLWENYLVSERLKRQHYLGKTYNSYFWRTTQQQEIDYIEEYEGKLYAYEFKWNSGRNVKLSQTFSNAYPGCEFNIISRDNYIDFIM